LPLLDLVEHVPRYSPCPTPAAKHFVPVTFRLPHRIGGEDVIAVLASFDEQTLSRLREMRGTRRRVFPEAQQRPALLHA
jgi:hypothetical protein